MQSIKSRTAARRVPGAGSGKARLRRRDGVARVAAATSALAFLTSAGALGGDMTEANAQSLYSITLAEQPFNGLAATQLGQDKGIFAHYGLKVTLKPVSTVAIITAEVQSGQAQIGYGVLAITDNAIEKGVGVKCVAPVETVAHPIKGYPQGAFMVAKNSSITSPKQLEGKTVGLPALQGPDYLEAKEAVTNAGGDWAKVKTAQIGFADMNAALKSGEIQAANEVSPFIEQGLSTGETKIITNFDTYLAGLTGQCYMASDSFISKNKALVDRFVMAQDQAILFAQAHPTEANAEIAKVSGLPAAAVKGSLPPKIFYSDDLKPQTMVKYEQWQKKWGGLAGPIIPASKLAYVAPGTPMNKLLFNADGKYIGG